MRLFQAMKRLSLSPKSESGVALIETLVALAILGLIIPAFIGGLGTAAQATIIADEQATAESLARGEIECVKSQDYYRPGEGPYQKREQRYEEFVMPASYSTETTVEPINPDTGEPLSPGNDQGIQKITVTVSRNSKVIFTLEDYKVDR